MITAIADFFMRVFYFIMAGIISLCALILHKIGYDPDETED